VSSANDNTTDALIHEIHELKHDIAELRLLLLYGLLKTEAEPRGRLNEALLAFAKQALKAASEQLIEIDRESNTRAAKSQPTRASVKSRKEEQTPIVDVSNEIAILKREMAKSLREAANDVDSDVEGDEE
jgi:hypothetical protein